MNQNQISIVVLDGQTVNPGDQSWGILESLGRLRVYERTSPEELLERARGAQILLTNKTPLSAQAIAALPDLRFIGVLATGYNVVDVAAARSHGVVVSNVPEYGTATVAQFTLALMLELCHRIGLHDESVHRGDWQRSADFCYWLSPQIELAGKTLGLFGFGKIGRAVGVLAHALGMHVLACSRRRHNPPAYDRFEWCDLRDLFSRSDVVSLHAPLTQETMHIVDEGLLSSMKPTAFLINTARGDLVNEAHLAAVLNRGGIAGAAVDVVSREPMRVDNPLLTAKNCIITPHIAWTALEARRRILATTAQNIQAFLAGRPIHVVGNTAGGGTGGTLSSTDKDTIR